MFLIISVVDLGVKCREIARHCLHNVLTPYPTCTLSSPNNSTAEVAAYNAGAAQAVEAQQAATRGEDKRQQESVPVLVEEPAIGTGAPEARTVTFSHSRENSVRVTPAMGSAAVAAAAVARGSLATTGHHRRAGSDEDTSAPGPQFVRLRPMLASDRSESSSSEQSAPSPSDPPDGAEYKGDSTATNLSLPPVAVPVGPLPLQPRTSSSGSATVSTGASVAGSGSGGGGGGDSMRSNRSTSSQGSFQLLGMAIISSVPSEDSFELSPESSPRRRRSPARGLEPVKETASPPGEVSSGTGRPSQEQVHPAQSSTEDKAVLVSADEQEIVSAEAQAKTSSDASAALTPIIVAVVDPPAYSPVREPSGTPRAAYSPLVVTSSPEERGRSSSGIGGLGAATAKGTAAGVAAREVAASRVGVMRWESTSDAGSALSSHSVVSGGCSAGLLDTETMPQDSAQSTSRTAERTASSAAPTVAAAALEGRQDEEVSLSPSSVPSRPRLESAVPHDENFPEPQLEPLLVRPQSSRQEPLSSESKTVEFRVGTAGRSSSVWDAEDDDESMQDDFTPSTSPRSDRTGRTESTLAGSSSSASQSASSAAASATAAASAATLAAIAARAAADQARVGIWSTQQQYGTRRYPSAMARSAAAAGAAAAAAAAATASTRSGSTTSTMGDEESTSGPARRAESKSSLRVRDPGLLRIASSQSTEAPSSKSISIMAPSPDGGGAYLFSRGESRAFGARRSSSLSSYPSFGLSSSGMDSSTERGGRWVGEGGAGGSFFIETGSRSGLFTDDESEGNPPENKASASMPAQTASMQIGTSGDISGASAGGSSSTDSNGSRAAAAAAVGAGQQAKPEREVGEVSALAQQPVVLMPSITGPAPRTPSAAPGGGTLFTLVPAQVEHQRRARASRSAASGIGGLGSSSSRMHMRKQSSSKEIGASGADEDSDSSETPRVRTRESSGSKSSSRGGTSTLRRAAVALASAAKAVTGRGSSGSSEAATGGAKRPRFSGEVETTGQPEAKKMMAQTTEPSNEEDPAVVRSESVQSTRSAKHAESGSSYESLGSTSGVRNPPILQRIVSQDEENKGYASRSSDD